MKLFWLTSECPFPPNTGGRVGIWKRLLYLAERNDIYLYTIAENNDTAYINEILQVCKSVKMYNRNSKLISIVKSCRYPYPAVSRWNKQLKVDLSKDYERINPDLVIIDFPQMIGALPSNILNGSKIVLNQHNIEYQSMASLAKRLHNPIKRLLYNVVSIQLKWYETKLYNTADIKLYTFVSETDKVFFENQYKKNNTLLVPVGAEVNPLNEYKKKNALLFVGKMSYPANNEAALWLVEKVYPLIKKEIPDVSLYLVGKDPGSDLIEKAKQDNSIIVTGLVESLDEYYEKTNIVLVPIFSGGGVNVKLLEALGKGKLVVTTHKGIQGTKFKAGKHLLVADDEEQFANYCLNALNNINYYIPMIKDAYDMVNEYYSWESIVNNFEYELRKLTKGCTLK